MANPEHLEIVKQGAKAIKEWRNNNPKSVLDLREADLTGTDLEGADLTGADLMEAILIKANLIEAILVEAILAGADLSGTDLTMANIAYAFLSGVDLTGANLSQADLTYADLRWADLAEADLSWAILTDADLAEANLFETILSGTILSETDITKTIFRDSIFNATILAAIDFSTIKNLSDLESIQHVGASYIDLKTLNLSQGKIPDIFLQRCGLAPWEILSSKMYDRDLSPTALAEINNEMMIKRQGDPIGGIFISYSHANKAFVEKLHAALEEKGYSVWRDAHDLVAGPLERQVFDAIRAHEVALLVLSDDSVNSDWVEQELKAAHKKEKAQNRPILCPITLDNAWVKKVEEEENSVLWNQITKKNIINFKGWKKYTFDENFTKLTKGLNRYYGKKNQTPE